MKLNPPFSVSNNEIDKPERIKYSLTMQHVQEVKCLLCCDAYSVEVHFRLLRVLYKKTINIIGIYVIASLLSSAFKTPT